MATFFFFFLLFSLYISSSLSLSLFLQLLFVTTNASTLTDVCSQTRVPPVCFGVLNSDPRSKSAALPELAQIAVGVAISDARTTKLKIQGILLRAKTVEVERACKQCIDLYVDAEHGLWSAEDQLKGRRYGEVYKGGLRVGDNASRCEAVFGIDSPVKTENLDMAIVGEAISVIAKNLGR